MRRSRLSILSCATGALWVAVSSVAFADDKDKDKNKRTTTTTTTRHEFRVERSSDMIGKPVLSSTGENLGEIQDFAVDVQNDGRVGYAIVSTKSENGTVMSRAVPIHALNYSDDDKRFATTIETEKFRKSEGFAQNQWPRMDDPAWATKIHEYYGEEPYWTQSGQPSGQPLMRVQRVSEIMGRSIQDERGQNLGKIEDLAIDPDTGRVAYNVISLDGPTGMNTTTTTSKYYAMPTNALDFSKGGRTARFTIESDRLKSAPSFESARWSTLNDPTYGTTVYEYYGQKQPYWVQTQTTHETTTTKKEK